MEFNEKLQELRKKKGLTQDELAKSLYVSRTAISKWESGRGYPSIDSLKAIAKFFSVTVDELLSSEQILSIAEEDGKKCRAHLKDLMFALLDISALLLLFLPLFAWNDPQFEFVCCFFMIPTFGRNITEVMLNASYQEAYAADYFHNWLG